MPQFTTTESMNATDTLLPTFHAYCLDFFLKIQRKLRQVSYAKGACCLFRRTLFASKKQTYKHDLHEEDRQTLTQKTGKKSWAV